MLKQNVEQKTKQQHGSSILINSVTVQQHFDLLVKSILIYQLKRN